MVKMRPKGVRTGVPGEGNSKNEAVCWGGGIKGNKNAHKTRPYPRPCCSRVKNCVCRDTATTFATHGGTGGLEVGGGRNGKKAWQKRLGFKHPSLYQRFKNEMNVSTLNDLDLGLFPLKVHSQGLEKISPSGLKYGWRVGGSSLFGF